MTVRNAILGFLIAATIIALPLQAVIDSSTVNIASASIVMASSLSVLLYILLTDAIETHPLSTFALFGFCVTTLLGALLVQTLAWTAVSGSLYDALYTFGTLAFYQTIALATHAVYRFFSTKRTVKDQILRGLLAWLGIYRAPSCGTLWFMGCVGLCTFPLAHRVDVLGKVSGGLSFLTWAPFLIPVYLRQIGPEYCNATLNRGLLVAYLGGIVLFGLALNTRSVMFQGVATVGLIYLLAGMRSSQPITGRSMGRLAALLLIVAAVAGPVSDLATSMVIARQWRGKVSATEMVKTTFFVFTRPNLIAAARARSNEAPLYGAYDERYVANPILNRMVNTKYHDNALHFGRSLTSADAKARLREVSMKFVWAGLPTPVAARLGIMVDKEDIAYSMGDYLAYLSRGLPLGGHRIGSMFAQGIALFGPVFPFIYAVMCLVLFAVADLLTVRPAAGRASLAALGMLQIWTFFLNGISYEGLHISLYFVFRNFEQTVLIYAAVALLARVVTRAGRPHLDVPSVPIWQRG